MTGGLADLAHPTTLKRPYRPNHPLPASSRSTAASTATKRRRTNGDEESSEEELKLALGMLDDSFVSNDEERIMTTITSVIKDTHDAGCSDFDTLGKVSDDNSDILMTPAPTICDPQNCSQGPMLAKGCRVLLQLVLLR